MPYGRSLRSRVSFPVELMFTYQCNSCKRTFWRAADYGVRECSPCGREHREIEAIYMLALRHHPDWKGLTKSMVMLKLLHEAVSKGATDDVKRRITVLGKRIAKGEDLHPDFSGSSSEVF